MFNGLWETKRNAKRKSPDVANSIVYYRDEIKKARTDIDDAVNYKTVADAEINFRKKHIGKKHKDKRKYEGIQLGVPMGHPTYVENELAKATHLVQEFCDRPIGLEHSQAAQLPLRFCCGACRVTHLLRTLPPDSLAETAAQIDDTMVSTCQTILGFPLSSPVLVSFRQRLFRPLPFLLQIGCLRPKADQSFSSLPLHGRFNWITWNNCCISFLLLYMPVF